MSQRAERLQSDSTFTRLRQPNDLVSARYGGRPQYTRSTIRQYPLYNDLHDSTTALHITEFVNESSKLVDSLITFSNGLVRHHNEALEKLRSINSYEIRKNAIAKAARTDLQNLVDLTSKYADRVDDLFQYGKSERRIMMVKQGIHSQDFKPLLRLIDQLVKCLVTSEKIFTELQEACEHSCQNSSRAEVHCKEMAEVAKMESDKTRTHGRTTSGVLIGSGVTAASVALAGASTFGLASLIGLGIGAFGLTAAGTATLVVHERIANDLKEAATALHDVSQQFIEINSFSSIMKSNAVSIKRKLESLSQNIDDIKDNYENLDIASLDESIDLLYKKFCEFHNTTSSCKRQLSKLTERNLSEMTL